MKKPDALRAILTAAIPDLQRDPDRLQLFVNNGRLRTRATGSSAYEQTYRLQLLLTDFAGEPEAVFVPLLAFLARHQRELLQNPALLDSALTFEIDLLTDNKVDISLELELSERVRVTFAGDSYSVEYLDEPCFEEDAPADSLLHRFYANGELLASCGHSISGSPAEIVPLWTPSPGLLGVA